jgi:phenylacetate-coenzyme A ligase PaaK-like adenylate-forming protein
MPLHLPPYDAWEWLQACQETWLAGLDPAGAGRRMRAARLARLIDRTRQDSPLYARRAGGARRLEDFEPVGKAELMENFDHWATDRRITRRAAEAHLRAAEPAEAWLGRYLLWTSSGTSGHPGLFVQDATSLAAYDALDALRLRPGTPLHEALGLWGLGRRFAYVGAIGGPYAGHVNLQRLQRLLPSPWAPRVERISVLEPMARVAARLQALQPQVLITYPSCAAALAQLQAEGQMALRLDELWLGGEQLTAPQRQRLARVFACPLRNSYGASEFYSIAFECGHGRLHLNEDWVVLEGVDARGRAVPAGTYSHTTLLTNLANHTQPLLRYALTDRVRFDPVPCACGCALPVIDVQGRGDDVLDLPGRRGGTVVLLPLALETVLEEDGGVTRFQLLVHADDRLELRLADPGGDAATFRRCREALQRHLAQQCAAPVHVTRGSREPALQPGSGKLRRVIDLRRTGAAAALERAQCTHEQRVV